MTAVPNWDVVGPFGSDAELVRASAVGDRTAFAAIYDRYADRLHDFCVGILADREGAADCVQDVFCIVAARLPQLRDADKLRPWLYSIARNEALRRIRERKRETPAEELPDMASDDAGPEILAARTELADLIAEAAGGLSDRDRSVLELAFRHGLDGPDLAEALGISASNANTIVHRLRGTIERSLGALLVSRRVKSGGGCPELSAMLEGWDGHFNVLMRKRVSRHIEACVRCDEQRRRLVSPAALLGAPTAFIPAPAWLRERTLSEIELTSATTSLTGSTVPAERADTARDTRSSLLPIGAFVAALIAALGLTFVWLNTQKTTIQPPIKVSESVAPPAPSLPSPPPAAQASVTVKPVPPVAPPVQRAPTPQDPVADPKPVVPLPITEPEPAPPPASPPPLLPPPDWTDWLPPWPPAPPPSQPPTPPPGGGFTGPGGLVALPPIPVPGGSAMP
jgi:RNA polymerase sigma factor (sigma-70 family)